MSAMETHSGKVHVWTIGDRLRVAREATGLDKQRFAEATGIHRNTVQRYEANEFGVGETQPRSSYLKVWAFATGYSEEWIRTGNVPDGGGTGVTSGSDSEQPPHGYLPAHRPGQVLRRVA